MRPLLLRLLVLLVAAMTLSAFTGPERGAASADRLMRPLAQSEHGHDEEEAGDHGHDEPADDSAMSEEGHAMAARTPGALSTAGRTLTLVGVALLLGLHAFRLLVWRPAWQVEDLNPKEAAAEKAYDSRSLRSGLLATGMLLAGTILTVLAAAGGVVGDFPFVGPTGLALLARLVLTLAAAGLLWLALRRGEEAPSWRGPDGVGLLAALGLGLTLTVGTGITPATALVDGVHVLAAGIWVGGVVQLLLAFGVARDLDGDSRAWLTLTLVLGFAAPAMTAVGLLLASGVFLASSAVGAWPALLETAYGRTLLLKFGLALVPLALAAGSLLILKPRLERAYETDGWPAIPGLLGTLRWGLGITGLVLVVVLLSSALLADQSTAVEASAAMAATDTTHMAEAGGAHHAAEVEAGGGPLSALVSFVVRTRSLVPGVALVLFAIGWGIVANRAAQRDWQLLPLLSISLVALWIGGSDLLQFSREYTPAMFANNPFPGEASSIAAGRMLYETTCATCHGFEGRGDGPAAATLPSPPADFTAGHTVTHPDGDLYYWIKAGIEGTPMPGWDALYSDEQVWHLVNYVRHLSSQGAAP